MSKWRDPKIKTVPRLIADIQDRLDELIMGGAGFAIGAAASAGGEDLADVSPNLIRNPGFEDWTVAVCDFWQSAEDNDWNTGSHYVQETTAVYSLPYAVKLGDGSNGSRGIAQESAFRVVPGESYYVSARLLGGDADVEYVIILKALESDGVTEITTGTPLGANWTYSAALGGWIITGVAGTEWTRITAPVTLAPDAIAEDVCYLRASIQYYQNGAVKYLYADDFSITRGSQLPAFSYYYLSEPTEPDAHKLLSLIHTDTLAADVLRGALIYGNATPKWAMMSHPGGQGFLITTTALDLAWFSPNVPGSILTEGAGSPPILSWLSPGDNGEVLKLVLGFPSWEAEGGGTTHSLLSATHTDSLPGVVIAGDLIYGNTTPAWARLAKGANGQILYMASDRPMWALTPSGGSLLYGISGSAWAVLAAGTAGYVLTMYGSLPTWRPSPTSMTAHALLGSTWHTDVLDAAPLAGALIRGDPTPKWSRLLPGADTYVLTMYGGYPTWRPAPSGGVTGSGTSGYIPAWLGTNPTSNLTNSNYFLATYYGVTRLKDYYSKGFVCLVTSGEGYLAAPFPRWGMVAGFAPEIAGYNTSGTVRGIGSLTFDPATEKVYYNGVELGGGGGVGGAGTTNYIPRWTGTTTLGNSVIRDQVSVGAYSGVQVGNDLFADLDQTRRLGNTQRQWSELWIGSIWNYSPGYIWLMAHLKPYYHNTIDLGDGSHKYRTIYAVSTSFGDLGFEEKSCAVCFKAFKRGDSIDLIVKELKEDRLLTVPKHVSC